ncbi:MAG: TonB-dependent receptor [Bacteroidota bacterium]
MKKILILGIGLLLPIFSLYSQQTSASPTQRIRGTVRDQDSEAVLASARIMVLNSQPTKGAISDAQGNFRIDNVPVGRVSLKVSYLGYEDKIISNLLLGSGKELILQIEMQESIHTIDEVIIGAQKNKAEVLNEMSLISARSFSVEETKRYAGAIDDPARMVSAFAGVNGNAEGNNDIIVRGNSSRGIQWRLEGVEIPNPNHFAFEGGTGGPINALNSNMLGNSDFFTGAFTPEYGNAYAAVFDMKLRNGNNEKREYSASLNVLGIDFTAEGPFKQGYAGSYLLNYRYSTLSLLDEVGILDFNGVPKYQDASFKVNLPLGDSHFLSMFGLGGLSKIRQEGLDEDNKDRLLWRSSTDAHLGVIGLSHMWKVNSKAYLKSTISAHSTGLLLNYDASVNENELQNFESADFNKLDLRAASTLNYKLNARQSFRLGAVLSRQYFDIIGASYQSSTEQTEPLFAQKGNAYRLQAFASWKYRISENLSMVSGLHYLQFLFNNQYSLEPRLAFEWQFSNKQSLNFGYGGHGQVEAISIYLAQQRQEDGTFTQANKDLALMKARHFVLGYKNMLARNLYLKLEAYYQHLRDVPIEMAEGSTWSLLNSTDGYTDRSLENAGTGTNYGLELSLERFFSGGFYYMSTLSLYKSLYTAQDGIRRNSTFDGNYVANFLGGKEFNMGKLKKNRVFFVNAKVALIGGQRYTPIDLEKSRELGITFRDESRPFSVKGDDIFKADLAIGIRRNRKKTTTELKLDIQNVSNNQAVIREYYEHTTGEIEVGYQLPLLPVISYRINF